MSSGIPPAMVPTAVLTITCGSILRYLSRSGSRTQDASGSPSWIGTAAPPVPTTTLASRSGWVAAANRAAEVPTSGATRCARPRSASVMSWARNSPIARGDSRSSRRSDAPNPGRSTANRRACSDSVAHIGANAYTLSGHGLVRTTVGFCELPLSAYRIRTPSIVRNRVRGMVVVGIRILQLLSGRSPWSVLGGQGGGEEVSEQLRDALGLVVVHPVRGVGQALDAVQVGDVVVVGLGEIGAEVAIAFPPDDQGGRLDRAKRRFGLLLILPHRGPVVVDHPGGRARLGPGLDVAVGFLRREGRAGVVEEVPEEVPVVGVHDGFGQVREVEEEEVPGPAELARVVQSLRQLPRVGRVEDGQPVHDLGVVHREGPRDRAAPVVTDQQRGLGAAFTDQAGDVVGQRADVVGRDAIR